MKPRDIEEPSLESIRRFQNMLDEDDESDYKVVSSVQQRLDHLLSSEDQVIDVSKPSRIKDYRSEEPPKITPGFLERIQDNFFALASFLAFLILYYLWKRRKRQPMPTRRTGSPIIDGDTVKVSSFADSNIQQSRFRGRISSNESTGHDRLPSTKNKVRDGESEVPDLQAEGSLKSQITSEMNGLSVSRVALPANSPESNATSLPVNLMRTNPSHTKSQILTHTDTHDDDSIRLYSKIARDIKLAEEVLTENGVERSLAQQLAVSMKTSQAVMESQRQLETQRMMVDSHHRNLDRQLSQKQHEEAIHASKYDPNWNEKLEKKRDKCWTATTRIVFEVLVIHYLSMILKPIMESFSSQSYLSFRELGRLAIYSICDCGSSGGEIVSSSTTTSLFSTSGTFFLLDLLGLDYILAMEAGLCYGYCLLTFGCTAVLTATVHQGLRIVSAPSLTHQMVNVVVLGSLFGGPSMWHSQHLSPETLLSFSKIHLLVIVLLSIYALVQWNYTSCKNRVQQARKSPMAFPQSFDRSLQQLDTLHTHLCFFRYSMVAVFCTSIFMSTN